jgi:hypothetical protein
MSFLGRYVTSDYWGYLNAPGESFFVILTDTTASFATADLTSDRYDTVQVRPVITSSIAKERDFLNPFDLSISPTTIDTKRSVTFEVSVITGTPGAGVAPATVEGYIKIAEVKIPANATGLTATEVFGIRDCNLWTTEENSMHYLNDFLLNEHSKSSYQARYNQQRFLTIPSASAPTGMDIRAGVPRKNIAYSKQLGIYLFPYVSTVSNQGILKSPNMLYWRTDHTNTPTPGSDTYGTVFWDDSLELFIAAGINGTTGYIHTSPGGTIWTQRLSITVDSGSTPSEIIRVHKEGVVACGFVVSGGVNLYSSINGTSWSLEASAIVNSDGHCRLISNERTGTVICLGRKSTGGDYLAICYTTIDAWQNISSNLPLYSVFSGSATYVRYCDIAYNKYLDLYVIAGYYDVGGNVYPCMIYSHDGEFWGISNMENSPSAFTSLEMIVVSIDGGFVCYSISNLTVMGGIWKSATGIDWENVDDEMTTRLEGIKDSTYTFGVDDILICECNHNEVTGVFMIDSGTMQEAWFI